MRKHWLALLAFPAVLVSVAALAQRPNPAPTPPPNYETQNRNAVGTQLMTGTVWEYAPGQSITIKAGDGKEYQMPLKPGVRVDGTIAVGHLAAVMWTTDTGGATRVMSLTGPPGAPADIEHSAPSPVSPPPATAMPSVSPSGASKPGPGGAARRTPQPDSPTPAPRPTPATR